MHEDDKPQFISLLSAAFSLYEKGLTDTLADLYWSALHRFDIADFRQALSNHVQNTDSGQYYPKPADLIRALEGTGDTKAMQAWSKVDKAVRTVGPYDSVVFDDPLIHLVISEMGGWISLGNVTNDEWPFIRNRFEKSYKGLVTATEAPVHAPLLIGISQASNERDARAVAPPVLIGDQQRAALVYQGGVKASPGITKGNKVSELLSPAIKRIPAGDYKK